MRSTCCFSFVPFQNHVTVIIIIVDMGEVIGMASHGDILLLTTVTYIWTAA